MTLYIHKQIIQYILLYMDTKVILFDNVMCKLPAFYVDDTDHSKIKGAFPSPQLSL